MHNLYIKAKEDKMHKTNDTTPCLAVFTCRGRDRVLSEGGSQAWRLSSKNAMAMEYVVCVQNRNLDWGNASHPHGTAFLIGRISKVRSLPKDSDGDVRKIIEISEYADINVADVWPGGRNPVAYMTLGDFGLNLADLEFHSLPAQSSKQEAEEAANARKDAPHEEDAFSEDVQPLSISQAKRGLAATFGVGVESIEIVIRA
jgi:hypothetical protein